MSSSDRRSGTVIGNVPRQVPEQLPVEKRPGSAILRGRPEGQSSRRPTASADTVVTAAVTPTRDWDGSREPIRNGSPGMPQVAIPPELAAQIRQARQIAEERGYAAGMARAEGELGAAIAAASEMAARLESAAPRETTAVAHAVVEVALAVVRKILDAEVSADPTHLVSAVEGAVSLVNGSPQVRIFLHPAAIGPVRAAWEAAHGRSYLGKDWVFEADPTLPRGGCALRHEHGFVDAGLEAQLEEIGIALDRVIPSLTRAEPGESVA